MIVIIDGNKIAKLQMTGNTSGFARNAFLCAAVSEEHESVVINQVKPWLVEHGGSVPLRNRKTNCIAKTLPQRTGRNFDTWGVVSFRMTRGDTVHVLESWLAG